MAIGPLPAVLLYTQVNKYETTIVNTRNTA